MKKPPRSNSLFFTRSGELSLGPLMLVMAGGLGSGMFVAEGFGWAPHLSVSAWAWFGSFTTMCFIAGAAVDRARLIAHSRTPGQVANAIAQAPLARPIDNPDL